MQTNPQKRTKKSSEPYLERIFHEGKKHLSTSEVALKYLYSRGVSDDQIKTLGLGFIPEDKWPAYVDPKTEDEDEQFYLSRTRKGSKLKGKLLFPMTNALGRVSAFQVRSPDTKVKDYWKFYSKRAGVDALFFGTNAAMDTIWETRSVYLVEGLFDLFPVQRLFPNTLCCGTAEVGADQIKFLLRYVDSVHIMFDHDEQGDRFFDKFYKAHRSDFDHIEQVPYAGKDPSDSWERLGPEGFRKQFNRELSLSLVSSHDDRPRYRG